MSEGKAMYQEFRDEDLEVDKLREALSAITHEIESFQNTTITPHKNLSESEEVLQKLIICKSMIKLKKNNLRKIKNNLRTACFVAKTVISSKENESSSLNSHLNVARTECVDLTQKNKKNEITINSLTMENRVLHQRLEIISNFVQLGYKELKKIRNEPLEEQLVELQLQKILICCGQYYADYCNEKAKRMQVEQNNRFLNSKHKILEKNLKITSEEVNNLRNHKERLEKEMALLKNKANNNINIVGSECKMQHQSNPNFSLRTRIKVEPVKTITKNPNYLDLPSYLSMIKHLLNDQETLLDDIKSISQELNTLDDVVV